MLMRRKGHWLRGVGRNGLGAVARLCALLLLAQPVMKKKVLRSNMAFPLILAGKSRVAAGEVEYANVRARVLLLDMLLECRLVGEDLLLAARLATGELHLGSGSGWWKEWAVGLLSLP